MSNKPLILSDNLFDSTVLHPTHVVSNRYGGEVAGSEYFRATDNLRDVTHFAPSLTNQNNGIQVDTGAATFIPDTFILDRGHNLAGKSVEIVAGTDDTFGTGQSITCTIPSTPGGLPADANGCLTPDGVWWKNLSGSITSAWRWFAFISNAMGASLSPIIPGTYLGTAYRFAEYYDAPGAYDYRRNVRYGKNVVSKGAVRVKRETQVFGEVDIKVRLEEADFQNIIPHVNRLLFNTGVWWFCLDDSTTEGAGLMRLFQLPGDTVYDPQANPVTREVALLLEEVIPSLVI